MTVCCYKRVMFQNHYGRRADALGFFTLINTCISALKSGVAKSQNCILVHGQVVLIKHMSVPMHFLSVLLQIQMQVFKNGLINKIMI